MKICIVTSLNWLSEYIKLKLDYCELNKLVQAQNQVININNTLVYLICLDHKDSHYEGSIFKLLNSQNKKNIILLDYNMDEHTKMQLLTGGFNVVINLNSIAENGLNKALKAVQNQTPYYDESTKQLLFKRVASGKKKRASSFSLTSREKEILKLIANGKNVDEIAQILNISFHTVKNHKKNMQKKTGCNNSPAMVKYGYENGILG